jgi:hypothetical protein
MKGALLEISLSEVLGSRVQYQTIAASDQESGTCIESCVPGLSGFGASRLLGVLDYKEKLI